MKVDRLLNTKEIAAYLGVSLATIYRLREKGMPVIKIANSARYDVKEVMEWIREQDKEEKTNEWKAIERSKMVQRKVYIEL